jgi:hypothetical protein
MKTSQSHLMMATALAAGLLITAPVASRGAEESATVPTNPGFKSNGQINPGDTLQVPSNSIDVRKIPTPEAARAAFLSSDDPNPVPGPQAAQPQNSAAGDSKTTSPQAASGDPTTATSGQAAIGGPLAPGASAGGGGGSSSGQQASSSGRETTGTGAGVDSRPGPIGATGQTMPETLSNRNEVLDRVPLMAFPLKLSDQERQQIYQAVMADKTQPAADADALMPASELSTDQALNGMHELPAGMNGIAGAKKLKFVKGKNKVLLVEPSTRIVVEQITS